MAIVHASAIFGAIFVKNCLKGALDGPDYASLLVGTSVEFALEPKDALA